MANLGTDGFKKGTKEIERAVKSLSSTAKRFGSTMTSSIKRLIPMILGVGSAYGVISKAVSSFMSQNEQLSARMSAIWTALGNVLGPIITQIINWVSTAVSYFLGFLKLLGITGKSASELSKSAKKNAGELQRTLAGFDELNVLQDNSGGGGAENPLKDLEPKEFMKQLAEMLKNGLWEDAGKLVADKMNELTRTLRSKIQEFGQVGAYYLNGALTFLATILKNYNWQYLGATLADGVNEILRGVKWTNLGVVLVGKLVALFGIVTGFLAQLDWKALATAISDTIIGALEFLADTVGKAATEKFEETGQTVFERISNGIIEFINNIKWAEIGQQFSTLMNNCLDALSQIDFHTIGESIANGLNDLLENLDAGALGEVLITKFRIIFDLATGFLEELDWGLVAQKLSELLMGALETASESIKQVDWWKIGEQVISFIENVEWGDIITALAEFVGSLAGALLGLIGPALIELGEWIRDEFDKIANMTWEGFIQGIKDTWDKITSWVREHIVDPFVNGVKKAFGIESPSTVMAEIGGYIIEGLLNGIKSLLPDLEALKETIAQGWQNLKDRVSGFIDSINPFKQGMEEAGLSAQEYAANVQKMSEELANAKQNFENAALYCDNLALEQNALDNATIGYYNAVSQLAQALGLTTDELLAQIEAADGDVTKIEALNTAVSQTGDAMVEGAGKIQEGADQYGQATDQIAKNATDTAEVVDDATKKINEATTNNTEAAAENATTNSQTMQKNTTSEFDTMKDETTDTTDSMKTDVGKSFEEMNTEASNQAKEMKNNVVSYTTQMKDEALMQMSIMSSGAYSIFSQLAYNAAIWGQDLMINFINGIDSMIPALESELYGMAYMVNSYIGFSKPEKGPLSDFDKYGPDMMDLLAEGIRGGAGKLTSALNDIAETVSYSAPGVAGGAILPYGVSAASSGGASADSSTAISESYDRLTSAITSLENALVNNDWVIDFGNFRMVARELTRVQRQMQRAEGV